MLRPPAACICILGSSLVSNRATDVHSKPCCRLATTLDRESQQRQYVVNKGEQWPPTAALEENRRLRKERRKRERAEERRRRRGRELVEGQHSSASPEDVEECWPSTTSQENESDLGVEQSGITCEDVRNLRTRTLFAKSGDFHCPLCSQTLGPWCFGALALLGPLVKWILILVILPVTRIKLLFTTSGRASPLPSFSNRWSRSVLLRMFRGGGRSRFSSAEVPTTREESEEEDAGSSGKPPKIFCVEGSHRSADYVVATEPGLSSNPNSAAEIIPQIRCPERPASQGSPDEQQERDRPEPLFSVSERREADLLSASLGHSETQQHVALYNHDSVDLSVARFRDAFSHKTNLLVPPKKLLNRQHCTEFAQLKWCGPCALYRPARAVHCRQCDRCVEKFDHHCPWVGNCVGRFNLPYFLRFCLCTSALSFCTFLYAVLHAYVGINLRKPSMPVAKGGRNSIDCSCTLLALRTQALSLTGVRDESRRIPAKGRGRRGWVKYRFKEGCLL
eukprot:g12444.t1